MITTNIDVQYLLISYQRDSHRRIYYGPFMTAKVANKWAETNLSKDEIISCEKLFYPLINEQK